MIDLELIKGLKEENSKVNQVKGFLDDISLIPPLEKSNSGSGGLVKLNQKECEYPRTIVELFINGEENK